MTERVALAAVGLAGAVLVAVGGLGLLVPDLLHELNGIPVAEGPALRSEVRGAGAALVLVGGLALAGASGAAWRSPAAALAGVVLLAYALGRGVSWVLDGAPGSGLAAALVAEIVLGAGALWAARQLRLGAHAPDQVASLAR